MDRELNGLTIAGRSPNRLPLPFRRSFLPNPPPFPSVSSLASSRRGHVRVTPLDSPPLPKLRWLESANLGEPWLLGGREGMVARTPALLRLPPLLC